MVVPLIDFLSLAIFLKLAVSVVGCLLNVHSSWDGSPQGAIELDLVKFDVVAILVHPIECFQRVDEHFIGKLPLIRVPSGFEKRALNVPKLALIFFFFFSELVIIFIIKVRNGLAPIFTMVVI